MNRLGQQLPLGACFRTKTRLSQNACSVPTADPVRHQRIVPLSLDATLCETWDPSKIVGGSFEERANDRQEEH